MEHAEIPGMLGKVVAFFLTIPILRPTGKTIVNQVQDGMSELDDKLEAVYAAMDVSDERHKRRRISGVDVSLG